jgi:hypothetical protein
VVVKNALEKHIEKEEQENQENQEKVENIKIIKFNVINNFILII